MPPSPEARKRLHWRKSRISTAHGACLEVAQWEDVVLIRNSNDPDGLVLEFTQIEWNAFLLGAKDGDFDDLSQPEPV